MNQFLRFVVVLALLYISYNDASRIRSTKKDTSAATTQQNNWEYALYTQTALRHGIQGSAISPNFNFVTVGSVVGQTIYEVNVPAGTFSTFVPFPLGQADDETWGPNGVLVWAEILSGLVRSRTPDGTIRIIGNASYVSPNGIAFDNNGNCYFSQYPNGNNLYKVNPYGSVADQEFILSMPSGMNGFDFSSENEIYGPFSQLGSIGKINLQTKTVTIVATGFIDPESVRFNADKSALYVLDSGVNTIYELNPVTGSRTPAAHVPGITYLDNFRPYGSNFLISDTSTNSLLEYVTSSKTIRNVTPVSVFNIPGGISYSQGRLYIADFTTQKIYNPSNGQMTVTARSGPQPASAGPAAVNISFGIFNVFASERYLAFSDFYDGRVQIRNTATNQDVVDTIPVGAPYGVALTSNYGALLVCDYGTGLRVNTGPQYMSSRIITVDDNSVVGLALSLAHANSVYVTTYSGKLFRVNYETGAKTLIANGFNDPEGIAVYEIGGQDIIIVSNVGAQTILRVTESGYKSIVAQNLPVGLGGPVSIPPPNMFTGVTLDSNNNIYVTSDLNDALIFIRSCD